MKKTIYFTVFAFLLILNSCVDKYELIEPQPEKNGTIFVTSEPDSAKIFLLGTDTKKVTPDSLTGLESGEYEITLKRENYSDTSITAKVYSGKTTTLNVKLKKIIYHGVISIHSVPGGASIFVNDSATGKVTPDSLTNLFPGTYSITLKLANYQDTSFTIDLGKNERISKSVVLKKSITEGSIYVITEPDSAQIFLDSINTGKITPDTLVNVNKGLHQLTLKREGYVDSTISVNVLPGEYVTVNVQLREYNPQGSITVDSNPQNADIYVNGEPIGSQTPYTIKNLFEGDYNLTLTHAGYYDSTFTVHVTKDQNTNVFIEMTPLPPMGNLYIQSDPQGANVFIDSIPAGEQTPAIIENILVGQHSVSLKLQDFADTTINVTIQENQTLDKFVFLRDITPKVQIDASYEVRTDGQIVFGFVFNQDVRLDSLIVNQPGNPETIKLNYFHQLILEGIVLETVFPEKVTGNWTFAFYGNKERGRKAEFRVVKFIPVQ